MLPVSPGANRNFRKRNSRDVRRSFGNRNKAAEIQQAGADCRTPCPEYVKLTDDR